MGTKSVRLDEDVYETVKAKKKEGETMSEAIERLIGGSSILDLYDTVSEKDADKMEEAIEEMDRRGRAEMEELGKQARER
jgi:predicted CopG family antitoxin